MGRRSFVAVALLAVVLGGGCKSKIDDAGIVTNIQSQMFAEPQLKNASVQVASVNGEVTLSGTVPSDAAHLTAYKIAAGTPGVTKVNDQVTVGSADTTPPPAEQAPAPVKAAPSSPPARSREVREASRKAELAENPSETTPAPVPPADAPAPPNLVGAPAPPPPPPPQPKQVEIAAGTTVTIRMIDAVDSSVNRAGEIFHASLEAPLVVDNQVVVPRGTDVYVRLVNAASAGKFSGKSELRLELVKLEFQGQSYPLVSGTYSLAGDSRGKNTAEKVGGGAVLGTLIGAIAGGGKGAAIGATVGAAGGGVYQGATQGKQVRIPSETKLDFQLDQPLTVTVMPRPAPSGQ